MKIGILSVLALSACGPNYAIVTRQVPKPLPIANPKPINCSVSQTLTGAVITCPDGTSVNISNGLNGTNGLTSLIVTQNADSSLCPTGGTSFLMGLDVDGDGVLEMGEVTNTATVCNGAVGAQGLPGVQGAQGVAGTSFAPVTPIEACGAKSSPWKEVLLCMDDGSILADFSANMSGYETRLSFIPSGSYEDTDDSGCNFNVSVDSNGDSTVSWGTGSNQYASWASGQVTCKNQAN